MRKPQPKKPEELPSVVVTTPRGRNPLLKLMEVLGVLLGKRPEQITLGDLAGENARDGSLVLLVRMGGRSKKDK